MYSSYTSSELLTRIFFGPKLSQNRRRSKFQRRLLWKRVSLQRS